MNRLASGPRVSTLRELTVVLIAFLVVAGWLVLTAASLARATHVEPRWTPQTVAPAVTYQAEEAQP